MKITHNRVNEETGIHERKCSFCQVWKDRIKNFLVGEKSFVCHDCKAAHKRDYTNILTKEYKHSLAYDRHKKYKQKELRAKKEIEKIRKRIEHREESWAKRIIRIIDEEEVANRLGRDYLKDKDED